MMNFPSYKITIRCCLQMSTKKTEIPLIRTGTRKKYKIFIILRWVSEKLNGFRANWNGTSLISKLKNHIFTPTFDIDLSSDMLDGEIW